MATIEINLETYQNLQKKAHDLESEIAHLRNIIGQKSQTIMELEESLDIIHDANLFDRIFGWKQITELTNYDK